MKIKARLLLNRNRFMIVSWYQPCTIHDQIAGDRNGEKMDKWLNGI